MDDQELDSLLNDLRTNQIDRDQAAFAKLIQLLQLAKWEYGQWSYYNVLHELANESALVPLIAFVQEGGAIWISSDAMMALGKIGGPEATEVLITATERRAGRPDALHALANIGGLEAVHTLIENLRFSVDEGEPDSDRDAYNAAQAGLESMGETVFGPLIAALNHENGNVRYGVAEILGEIGNPTVIPALKAALESEKDIQNQDNLRYVLKKLEGSAI
jgi:HEAT repeat protein